MLSTHRLAGISLAFGLAACAGTQVGPPLKMTDLPTEVPTEEVRARAVGELLLEGAGMARGATYGMWRVGGTRVDLVYADGAWTGTLGGQATRLVVTPGKIEGAGVNLFLEQEGETVTVRGRLFQRQIWITMTPKKLSGKVASNAPGFELERVDASKWSGSWGLGASVFLTAKGEAARYPDVAKPQFYLALLGTLL